jgi:hypothetical protein
MYYLINLLTLIKFFFYIAIINKCSDNYGYVFYLLIQYIYILISVPVVFIIDLKNRSLKLIIVILIMQNKSIIIKTNSLRITWHIGIPISLSKQKKSNHQNNNKNIKKNV